MKGLRREELVPWPSFSFCMLLSSIACPRLQNFTQLGRFWLFYGVVPKPEEELPRKFFFNEPTPFDFYLYMIFIFSPLSFKLFTQIVFFSLLQQIYLISIYITAHTKFLSWLMFYNLRLNSDLQSYNKDALHIDFGNISLKF